MKKITLILFAMLGIISGNVIHAYGHNLYVTSELSDPKSYALVIAQDSNNRNRAMQQVAIPSKNMYTGVAIKPAIYKDENDSVKVILLKKTSKEAPRKMLLKKSPQMKINISANGTLESR